MHERIEWRIRIATRIRRYLSLLGAAVAVGVLARGLLRPSADLRNHLESGRRLLAGEPLYAGDLNFVYPPAWGLAHAPLSLLPQPLVYLLFAGLAMAVVPGIVRIVGRLGGETASAGERFGSAVLAVLLASPFLLRDLADGGANLLLLGLVWCGIGLWARDRDALGGALIGLATALKCTPVLYLAYFAWKRQGRLVAAGLLTAAIVSVAPAACMGWGPFAAAIAAWNGRIWAGITDLDPAGGVLPRPDVVNVALRPALAIYLAGPREWLGPDSAGLLSGGFAVVLVAGLSWVARGRIADRGRDAGWQLAAVAVLTLLLSPITWKQHCVATLPALLLLSSRLTSGAGLRRCELILLALFSLLVLPLRTDLLGDPLMTALDQLGIKTLALLLLLSALALAHRSRANAPPPRSGRAARAETG